MTVAAGGAGPFIRHHRRYEEWFERHRAVYHSELLAVRAVLPRQGRGLEIGVGTGRFAAPLGIEFGIDPAVEMLDYARARGVAVVAAIAEALPFRDAALDYVLIVTTLCFVDDAAATLKEAARVLRPGGALIIGEIDRESAVGRDYVAHHAENVFYANANFYSAGELEGLIAQAGFRDTLWLQTLSAPIASVREIEAPTSGHGRGAFLVLRARLPEHA